MPNVPIWVPRFAWRGISRSPLGVLVAVIHGSLLILAISNMSPPSPQLAAYLDSGGRSSATLFAGRPFHLHYESLLLKMVTLLDLPALLASAIILIPLGLGGIFTGVGRYVMSYVDAGNLLVFASAQWWLVGRFIESRLCTTGVGTRFVNAVRLCLPIVVGAVVGATLILAVILNHRSAGLGFRHGGISFWR
jgi:hypothetical protein